MRATFANTFAGGPGALWKLIMDALSLHHTGHDMSTAGVALDMVDGTTAHIWIDLQVVVADEAPLHSVFACKGSSGVKTCPLCANIFHYKCDRGPVAKETAKIAQHHALHGFDKLVLHTPASVDAIIAQLHANVGRPHSEDYQTRVGWNWVPCGAMADDKLRKRGNTAQTCTS